MLFMVKINSLSQGIQKLMGVSMFHLKMLPVTMLVRIIENNKIIAHLGQVRLSKGCL